MNTEHDLELTILHDLDFEPPCDAGMLNRAEPLPCDAAAEWFVVYTCGHERLFCTPHKDYLTAESFTPKGVYCGQCYTVPPLRGHGYPKVYIMLVEPLSKAG